MSPVLVDPLAQIITLLRPRAVFAKGISGAGRWAVGYPRFGQPGFCAVLEGACRLAVEGEAPVRLEAGDFVLLPATPAFVMSSHDGVAPVRIDPHLAANSPADDVRHGRADGPADVRLRGGYFMFDSQDAALLVSLLPRMIHIHGDARLAALVHLFGDEAASSRAGRDLVLERLVEILLIETLRTAPARRDSAGLLHGLADPRISAALRALHGAPAHDWTVERLARAAGLSRSAFFSRFSRTVGMRPMEYLMAWRMALAKDLLRDGTHALDGVAARVGYGSASTFSTAFSRHVGEAPGRFARAAAQSRLLEREMARPTGIEPVFTT